MTFTSIGGFTYNDLCIDDRASEETLAFSAAVTRDGMPSGIVRNDGHGGCDVVRLDSGVDQRAFEALAVERHPDCDPFTAAELLSADLFARAAHVAAVERLVTHWHGQKGVDVPGGRVVRRDGRLSLDVG